MDAAALGFGLGDDAAPTEHVLMQLCAFAAGVEIAEGIPAPFPLVAHNPAAQPPRPPLRAPRQASRHIATQTFTTCLLSDEPLSLTSPSPPDQGATPAHAPAMNNQHTAAAPGASGPVPQHDGGNTRSCEGEHDHMFCDERLDDAGHGYQGVSHAQQHDAKGSCIDEEMAEAPAEHSAHPHSAAEHSAHPHSAAEHSAHPRSAAEHTAHPHSGAEHSAHPRSAAEHSAHPHSVAEQPAQSQVSNRDLHNQSCEDSSACQQTQDIRAQALMHHDDVQEPQGAPAAYPHNVEYHQVPQLLLEQQQASQPQLQQQQQRGSFERLPHSETCVASLSLPQQQQVPAGAVQHDQVVKQMHAPVGSPASGSHPPPSQQSGNPPNSNNAQAGNQEAGPSISTAAAAKASAAPAAARALVAHPAQSPQRLHALPLLDPALLAQLSRHAHPLDTAAAAHHASTEDEPRSQADPAAPVVPVRADINEQPAGVIAAAQSTLSHECPQSSHCLQSPQQQMQSEMPRLSAHDEAQQAQAGTHPNTSTHACPGNTDKTYACWHAEEGFEQDQLSQPSSSSESDEDFQPSEYEQDELSQPSSSSDDDMDEDEDDDAFEVDELSQPESSSEDDEQSPLRAESSLRVRSTAQTQPSIMIIKSKREDEVRKYTRKSSRPQLLTTAASGRSGVKRSRQGHLSADHKARLGFPKPAQPAKAVPVPKGCLIGSRLPSNGQTLPVDQSQRGLKRTVPDAAAQQGGQKRMRTTASPSDAHKASAGDAQTPNEEGDLQALAAQQVSHELYYREWQTHGYTIKLTA